MSNTTKTDFQGKGSEAEDRAPLKQSIGNPRTLVSGILPMRYLAGALFHTFIYIYASLPEEAWLNIKSDVSFHSYNQMTGWLVKASVDSLGYNEATCVSSF